ncbi:ornithine cyclodeaminase family protein [Ruegeria pomeroyi]|uniref:Ornithine cyclodeaminase/mu-crystallin family protein n=2 Tax=Ruegeria pomeroyi TaxID=89184 RepID=Q5LLT9_RUEPO|nr:ornithine cyclodeaminase family protein [Ruegeria pomeroyi]HCE71567.1 ornithine cyclodeaminase family protein [Ruegeria sp.]AAV97046.1 ornithine cyclodeaminase/mu-crystallin family protein [Ruegeria pomeroyi DSS-3]NVK99524.1 ornithine cyclodeaminase family protein [Ruegeria pomeroyi]NVL00232.1 ornithine cyclodeaminase family protein [Ruegeria pomeroyi]QWV10570.1 ornithine cyclodeaminase family protein [Ruegeria pomeroyi]
MKIISAEEIRQHLPMRDAIEVVEKTMIQVSQGKANLPLRTVMDINGTNRLGVMPGALSDPTLYGIKVLSLFPGNPAKGLSSHTGTVLLFDAETGQPRAALDADAITAIRTAAATAVATRALARSDAQVLALIGTGEQAESHIEALTLVREIAEIRVAGRNPERAAAFVRRMADHYPGITFTAATDVEQAVSGADIVCTLTSSPSVVLHGDWIGPGTHVNAVGASIPSMQEIDETLLLKSELFVDYRPSAFAQAREIISALETGAMSEAHVRGEIGEVLSGKIPGRSGTDAITLYRSLGIAAQDLACADHVCRTIG